MTRCPWKEAHQPWPSLPGITTADLIPLCIHVLASVVSVEHSTRVNKYMRAGIIPVMSWEGPGKSVIHYCCVEDALSLWEEASEGCRLKPFHTWQYDSACFKSVYPALSLEQSLLWSKCLRKCDSASKA